MNFILETGGNPINTTKVDTGFWNVIPFIFLGAITVIWIITVKLLEWHHEKKKKTNTKNLEVKDMSNENLICPICGEPTNVYMGNARRDRLCKKHGSLANKGEIKLCTNCGKWYKTDENCQCTKSVATTEIKENTSDITCILCGEPSNGKHFCLKCYREYKDHSVDIRIKNCRDIEIIDKYGNKKIKTKDGRFVRSLSEKIILDYFFDHYVRVVYEKTIPYINEKGENAELYPDFYLQDYI